MNITHRIILRAWLSVVLSLCGLTSIGAASNQSTPNVDSQPYVKFSTDIIRAVEKGNRAEVAKLVKEIQALKVSEVEGSVFFHKYPGPTGPDAERLCSDLLFDAKNMMEIQKKHKTTKKPKAPKYENNLLCNYSAITYIEVTKKKELQRCDLQTIYKTAYILSQTLKCESSKDSILCQDRKAPFNFCLPSSQALQK